MLYVVLLSRCEGGMGECVDPALAFGVGGGGEGVVVGYVVREEEEW